MFDINKAIRDSKLPKIEILHLQKEVKKDYPHDSMLYELHFIRALKAKRLHVSVKKSRHVVTS